MNNILPFERINEVSPYMDSKVFDYVETLQNESFEEHDGFVLMSFEWFAMVDGNEENSRIVIYLDKENLFFFCETDKALTCVKNIYDEIDKNGNVDNEQILYAFFARLLKGNINLLDVIEESMNDIEEKILCSKEVKALERISGWRRLLLELKRYYEQLNIIFDEMSANDNSLLKNETVRKMSILGNRTDRYLRTVKELQDYAGQLYDIYQSQLSIQQNDIMKIFTIITSVFLPLTLITGWYGMNFSAMPEIHWKYGYLYVIAASAAIVAALIWYLRKKKWI